MLSAAVKALPALLLAFGLLLCFVLLSPFPTHEVLELIVPPQFALFLAFVFLNASLLLQSCTKMIIKTRCRQLPELPALSSL